MHQTLRFGPHFAAAKRITANHAAVIVQLAIGDHQKQTYNWSVAGEVTIKLSSRIDRLDAVELDAGDMEISAVKEAAEARY